MQQHTKHSSALCFHLAVIGGVAFKSVTVCKRPAAHCWTQYTSVASECTRLSICLYQRQLPLYAPSIFITFCPHIRRKLPPL
mgnify:CR=1 FL=1